MAINKQFIGHVVVGPLSILHSYHAGIIRVLHLTLFTLVSSVQGAVGGVPPHLLANFLLETISIVQFSTCLFINFLAEASVRHMIVPAKTGHVY